MRTRTANLTLALLILTVPLLAGEPQDLYSKDYFPTVHQEFQNAKESIVVTMYQIRLYPQTTTKSPTFTLVRDLIDAHNRGVKVTVILNNPYRSHRSEESTKTTEKRNSTQQILTANGITVRHVSTRRVLHQKVIVIDGETVICGSHNWTDTSLKYNVESSILIRSAKYAAVKLKQISQLDLLPGTFGNGDMTSVVSPEVSVSTPLTFLTRKDLAQNMMKDGDHRAFDLYLLLYTLPSPISLNHSETASALGMKRRTTRTAYRRQITKTLRKLQDQYHLIQCTFHYSANTDIKLLPTPSPSIQIPLAYWQYGLSTKLTLPAKGAYLICLAEEAQSPGRPWWTSSGSALADKYPGCRHTIVRGLREIEKMDLLEIVRTSPPPGQPYSRRRPNSYRLKPLLSPEAIRKGWKELSDAYGPANLKRARSQADTFDRRNNPAVVADLLMLADTYGWRLTGKAVGEVAKMAPDNPCRHVGYIITLLRDWTKEGDVDASENSRPSGAWGGVRVR